MEIGLICASISAITGIITVFIGIRQNKTTKRKPAVTMEGCVSPISTTISHIEKESIIRRNNY